MLLALIFSSARKALETAALHLRHPGDTIFLDASHVTEPTTRHSKVREWLHPPAQEACSQRGSCLEVPIEEGQPVLLYRQHMGSYWICLAQVRFCISSTELISLTHGYDLLGACIIEYMNMEMRSKSSMIV